MEEAQLASRFPKPRKLAAWKPGNPMSMDAVRDLTLAEERRHQVLLAHFVEARNRLKLFAILGRNYKEWDSFIAEVKASQEEFDIEDELNRLILNYLTCAYTIWEHNKVSVRRRFRKEPKQLEEYEQLLEKLTTEHWAFAFISDFRGYVQHMALAVGAWSRNVGDKSAEITVTANPAQLLKESRDWKKSQLTADRGPIDLIAVLTKFHRVMCEDYWRGLAKTFLPGLVDAHTFYQGLAAEVEKMKPGATMVFLDELEKHEPRDGKERAKVTWSEPPSDVFAELGMKFDGLRRRLTAQRQAASQQPPPRGCLQVRSVLEECFHESTSLIRRRTQ